MSAPARQSAIRDQLLSTAAAALEGAGVVVEGTVRVVISCGPDALRFAGEPPATAPAALGRLPSQWQRVLDCMNGANEPLSALEIHRRLNRDSLAVKAPPELYARLQDMESVELIIQTRQGYQVAAEGAPGPA